MSLGNVGDVTLQGFDGQLGWSPFEKFNITGSVTYTDSEVKNNLPNGVVGGVPVFNRAIGSDRSRSCCPSRVVGRRHCPG